jgi:hypothetical protein
MNYSVVDMAIKILCDGFRVLCEASTGTGDRYCAYSSTTRKHGVV